MNKTIAPATLKELQTLIGTVAGLNNTGEYTAFYAFSGHVCMLTVEIYRGKWGQRKKPLIDNYMPLDRPLSKREVSEGTKDIPQLIDYINNLIKQTK